MKNNGWLRKAKELDAKDPLKAYGDKFLTEDSTLIYLDGNSLGKLPLTTLELLKSVIHQQWGLDLIDSWNKNWYNKSLEIGNKIARLVGADEGEVIISDNTSTNLYKLAKAAIQIQNSRKTILSDNLNFPSDLYILQGIADQQKLRLDIVNSRDALTIHQDDIKQHLTKDVALVSFTHVAFKSAFMYDMARITAMAHEVGALMLWDLSHSAGAVPLDLNVSNIYIAVVCTYKYLNGGPGAPAFLYVRKELQDKLFSPVQGWFGAAEMFDFKLNYQPEEGIRRFLTGTPPVMSLSAIEPGVDLILEAGIMEIRRKSILMSEFFIDLWNSELKSLGYTLASPVNSQERGSHISIAHEEAFRIAKALMDKRVDGFKMVPDFRAPHNIRLGFAPLYNSFMQVYLLTEKLKSIAKQKLYLDYDNSKDLVT